MRGGYDDGLLIGFDSVMGDMQICEPKEDAGMSEDNVVYGIVRDDKVFKKIESGVRKWTLLSDAEPVVMKSIVPGAKLLMADKNEKKLLSAKILEAEKMNIYGGPVFMVRFGVVKEVLNHGTER